MPKFAFSEVHDDFGSPTLSLSLSSAVPPAVAAAAAAPGGCGLRASAFRPRSVFSVFH